MAGGTVTITNTSPDQTVTVTGAGINTVTGTYPNFTVTATEVDGDISNECNTAFAVTVDSLKITDNCGTLGVPLSAFGTPTLADNGLSMAGDTVHLGGELLKNTSISQLGYNFIIDNVHTVSGLETHIEQSNNIAGIGGEGVGFWSKDTSNYLSALYSSGGIAATSAQDAANTQFARTINIAGIGNQASVISVSDGVTQNDFMVDKNNISSTQYPQTRDDSGITPPINFLYTDGSGVFQSAPLTEALKNEWHTTGNAGTTAGTNFVGTTDAQDLVLKTNGVEIARFGQQGNAAIGSDLTSLDPILIPPTANNIGSMAFQSGQATGLYSTAFHLATASGDASMAWGVGYNHGISPIASGVSSTAWGGETSAVGSFSTCFGFQNIANGDQSTCFGQENTNNANYATVFGFQNTAEGYLSTIFGSANISDINGGNSTIWGTGNQVSNAHGTAWGQDNVASGISSTVFGKSNRSEALYSLASGFNNVASGDNSVVFGAYNNSVSYAEMVLGHFSTFYIPISITTINTADRLLTVGNGANALTTNNALTLWKDGRSMWNGDVAKQNTWIGVNGTNPQNFINVTTPTGAIAAISTEHTTSGNYAVLGSNAGNSGLTINNTKQFAFTTTAGTTSTALGATTTVANYNNTGFLFGGGGTAAANLHLAGSEACDYTTIAATTTLLPTNRMVYVNNGATNITITIPAGDKLLYTITRLDNTSTGTITVQLAGGTIQDVGGTIGATTSISAVAGQRSETFHVTGTVARRTTNQ